MYDSQGSGFQKAACCFLLTIILLLITSGTGVAGSGPRVLILNSYHKGFKWTDAQVSSAEQVLTNQIKGIEIFVEYMDTKRIYHQEYLGELSDLYHVKYGSMALDTVVTTDDNALWFALKHHANLFGEAPIVFCGINDYREHLIAGNHKVTGVVEVLDIGATLDLILKLHPGTDMIVVLTDGTPTGQGQLKDIRSVASRYKELGLRFKYIRGEQTSHQELFERLGSLPQGSVVLLTVWLRDKHDVYLSPSRGGRLISKNSAVPVYGIIDMYFGAGIVGGKLLNSKTHGRIAAQKAVRILQGTDPSELPVTRLSVNPYMFDYEQLKRWGIEASALPVDSMIINEPFSLYEEYTGLIYVIVSAFCILLVIVLLLTLNIIRRRKVEQKLQISEEKFRKIFQDHAAVKLLIDPESGSIEEANEAAAGFYGWSTDTLTTMRIQEINVLSGAEVKAEMEMARSENRNHFEFQHRLADGSLRDVEVFSSTIQAEGRELLHSIIHDITERKQAEALVRENENKFRNIFDLSPQAIALSEFRTGRLVDINEKLCELTQYAKEDLLGKTTTEIGLYADTDRSRFIAELREQGRVNGLEMEFVAKDGSKLIALMFSRLIDLETESLILTIFFDLTNQKQLEGSLRKAQRMEAIGNLAGGIAHDFNNILSPIVGLSELLLDDFPSHTQEYENVREILIAGRRGSDLVKQILAFSRQAEHTLIPVHLQQIAKEVFKLTRSFIPREIKMIQEIQENCGTVKADATQIHQVAMNLITNAYHAVEAEGGTISMQLTEYNLGEEDLSVTSLPPGRYARLTIEDTGHGIEPDIRGKIFEPYFTTKEKGKGTGLGLATVYGIVQEHGGDIQVASEPGKGTAFTVYLPVMEEIREVRADTTLEKNITGTERILLIDDEEPIARLEKQILERLGYEVTFCNDSLEALALFQAHPEHFDLVATDLSMPNLSGERLAEELLAIRPELPIILCTGFSERINEEYVQSIGIKGFLMKPIARAEMGQLVRKLLDGGGEGEGSKEGNWKLEIGERMTRGHGDAGKGNGE